MMPNNITARLSAIRGLEPLTQKEQSSLDITSVKKGGYLELGDQTWKVTNVFYYLDVKWESFNRRKKDYWVCELELFSLNTGLTSFVEWERDDEIEVCQTDALIKIRDINFDGKALKRDDLDYIAEEEEGVVTLNGVSYSYSEDDTWAGLFMTSKDDKDGTPMRAYEFEADDGKCLTIETWHQDSDDRPDREAFVSHSVSNNKVTVLQSEGLA